MQAAVEWGFPRLKCLLRNFFVQLARTPTLLSSRDDKLANLARMRQLAPSPSRTRLPSWCCRQPS
eukprot:2233291-Amphidinium_carterae.1